MGSALYFSISTSLLYLLGVFFLVSSVEASCHPDDHSALLQFKQSFIINSSASSNREAYPKTETWESGRDCCSWDGVECDNGTRHRHVISLDLASSFLYGSLNSNTTLFRLVHLQSLDLSDNTFPNSEIPSEIKNLSKLTSLVLFYSNFSGHLPSEFFELSELETLDLSGNPLKLGKQGLRSLLQKFTNLQQLYLGDVKISSSVPNYISPNFSSLTTLILSNCDLRGEFPPVFFELPNLQFLSLESNPELTGYLPENIQDNHSLLKLSLASTGFSGKLPGNFFKSLDYLDINNCHFSGEVPYSLAKLTQLQYLDLSYNNFSGAIPLSIGNLNQLMTLDFSNNNFSGEIPSSLSNLTQLLYLSLANNNFNPGNLSCLGTQTQLTYLDLSNTSLIGNIPSSLQNLTQITFLYLGANELDGGIPTWIGNYLPNLIEIKLQHNILNGVVPESIFKLENLEILDLQRNRLNGIVKLDLFLELKNLTRLQLSGNNLSVLMTNISNFNVTPPKFKLLGLASCNLQKFPDFLRGQDELEILELADNRIHGLIPKWFWTVGKESLNYLNLGFNYLTDFEELPDILPWTGLEVFSLESNMLQGSLPNPQPSIISYLVSNNSLSGEIPPILCNLSSLLALDLSNNNLTGTLPQCLDTLSNSLKVLNLRSNHFSGDIPWSFSKSCALWMVDLSHNQLQGTIPRSLAHCTMLESLNLGKNLINDTFPSWLGTLPRLKVLILRANELGGSMDQKPQAKSDFSKLQVIDLSENSLRGELPSDYFKIWNAMQFSNSDSSSPYMNANTSFQGEIPETIGSLKLIRILNLSNNNLNGHILPSLGYITNLESLDLSRNKLFGKIPPQLANLNFLEHFNVSYNNLDGPIPRGQQFNTFNNDSYEGNSRLCGSPLSEKCGNSDGLLSPPSLAGEEEDEGIEGAFKFGWKIVLIGYGGGLIIGISFGHNFNPRKHEWFIKVFKNWPLSNRWNNGSSWSGSFSFIRSKVLWNYTS
ncbi:hypothetical protein CCACVL1_10156 [Corchorus capsularis]|uniref:Uncharacterized protein n=1 Tax=Corchorus capsularis TaxID=210143 RepID=A0A1R3ISD7_COCAP|nr:hypothetical protein CCACVL1_10156 [Corchorus capsularis]